MAELIDIVDREGMPTGVSLPRDRVHAEGHWHRTVHVWVYNSQGEILVQKRHHAKDSYPGRWDVSSAGHISAGEPVKTSAARELSEELGIEVGESDLVYLFDQEQKEIRPAEKFFDNEIASVFAVRSDVTIDKMALQESEVTAVRFISTETLAKESQTDAFVPHIAEYEKIIRFINTVAEVHS